MDANEFSRQLQLQTQKLKDYVNNEFPTMAGNKALRFIDGNFRAQGWQGSSFQAWKGIKRKGTILVKKGNLRNANSFVTQPAMVTIKNSQPYAQVHNNGFNGTVNIPEHTRRKFEHTRVGTGRFTSKGNERTKKVTTIKSTGMVKAPTRKMNIPKRQFMPTSPSDSPILENAILRGIEKALKTIFPN